MSTGACIAEEAGYQQRSIEGIVVGRLIGFADGGQVPLVIFPGQPHSAALSARSLVDLHAAHVGREVVLMFDGCDPRLPIVMGWLRVLDATPLPDGAGNVDIDCDGERLIVSAKEQVVLRCGEASITLTRAGKVLIQGAYVLSHSSGANRVKGGSVELN
jgi:hypothetical protein